VRTNPSRKNGFISFWKYKYKQKMKATNRTESVVGEICQTR
jgi:hypothetical protein